MGVIYVSSLELPGEGFKEKPEKPKIWAYGLQCKQLRLIGLLETD